MKTTLLHKILCYVALILFALIWIAPVATAFDKSMAINGWKNYQYILTYQKINYFQVVGNSMIVAVSSAVIVGLITTLGGYAFSKLHFHGQKAIYLMILACLAVPVASVTMPLFVTIKAFHLIDTHLGLIIPLVAFNAPMMLMMIKNYFDGIPNELLESAQIDGASSFCAYRNIMLPLSGPILANVLVLTFIYTWNDYLIPLLVVRTDPKYTVTLAAQYFMSTVFQSPTDVARIYAAMLLLSTPSIIIYLFSQKYLQTGITAGAIKG
ncbi:MAG: carbohydrate ABC transporter permease [Sphaerochaeta sp.]|jgi:raffinose/stachyose/melibiose transport system permease protein|nr:carbohydrate ABC transporter permease [Sphaerochaeta sp.]